MIIRNFKSIAEIAIEVKLLVTLATILDFHLAIASASLHHPHRDSFHLD